VCSFDKIHQIACLDLCILNYTLKKLIKYFKELARNIQKPKNEKKIKRRVETQTQGGTRSSVFQF
jgi:hypothetical protein